MKTAIVCLMVLIMSGCALENTANSGIAMAKDVTLKLADRVPIDSGAMAANAELNNPHYRVLACVINGVLLDVGLDGAQVGGHIQGQGSGGPATLDQDLRERLDVILHQPDIWDKLLEAAKDVK